MLLPCRQLTAALLVFGLFAGGCNIVPSRDPTGEFLPLAEGSTLDGTPITLSQALGDEPAVLLLPYTTDAQIDADRWALGLLQLQTPIRRFELGVVPSTFGIVLAPAIDANRRTRRAMVTWPDVLVFRGPSADAIATQTGMGDAQYARVMLVDRERRIVWWNDRGFTPERVTELDHRARELIATARPQG